MDETITRISPDNIKRRKLSGCESSASTASPSPRAPKQNDALVTDELECQICLEFAVSPIQNCKEGHIVCGSCVTRLLSRHCPTCKAKLVLSALGERMAKRLEFEMVCDFAEAGCRALIKSTEFKKHILGCDYRNIRCPKLGCMDKVAMQEFVAHIKTKHLKRKHPAVPIKPYPFRGRMDFFLKIPKDAAWTTGNKMSLKILDQNGKSYILIWTKIRNSFVACLTFLGNQEKARRYRYKLTPKHGNRKPKVTVSWTLPMRPYHDFMKTGFRKESQLVAAIPMCTLASFCKSTDSPSSRNWKVQFAIEVFKRK